ncbi:MAG: methylmalonyl-CoA epimerase [Planctomycetes bacterium]|nr:methylmalonyl-CoA epimerase [Planctomycetota bacterium]
MKALRLDHIGVAVQSLESVLPVWRDLLGLPVEEIEEVPEVKVRVAKLSTGNTTIELVEPLPGEEATRRFLDKRGEGIHHICLEVADLAAATAELVARGMKPVLATPRAGAGGRLVNFLSPKDAHGVLIELSQRVAAAGT